MSEETLQVLHVVDLLESTEGKSDLSYDPILGKNVIKIKNLFTWSISSPVYDFRNIFQDVSKLLNFSSICENIEK